MLAFSAAIEFFLQIGLNFAGKYSMATRTRKSSSTTLTRLMRASASGQTTVVKDLLESGIEVNVRGPRNSTALMFAAGAGHLDIVKELVEYGADVSLEEDGGWSAIRLAKEDGNEEIVSFLEKGSFQEASLQARSQSRKSSR